MIGNMEFFKMYAYTRFNCGIKAVEIREELSKSWSNPPSLVAIHKWISNNKNGEVIFVDDIRSGRPSIVKNDDNLE
jgi:hypothetical protein